jgi:hypothetical protein
MHNVFHPPSRAVKHPNMSTGGTTTALECVRSVTCTHCTAGGNRDCPQWQDWSAHEPCGKACYTTLHCLNARRCMGWALMKLSTASYTNGTLAPTHTDASVGAPATHTDTCVDGIPSDTALTASQTRQDTVQRLVGSNSWQIRCAADPSSFKRFCGFALAQGARQMARKLP